MAFAAHLFLIGYRGSGKTSVALKLSHRLHVPFVDTDRVIEESAGMSIRQIFDAGGETRFRDLESKAIATAIAASPQIVSLGGGAILRQENRDAIGIAGKCVWLKASAATLAARIEGDPMTAQQRPSLSEFSVYDEIVHLLGIREPIYQQLADLTVLTEGKTPEKIAEEIANWLNLE